MPHRFPEHVRDYLNARQQALANFGHHALKSRDLDSILNEACQQVAHGLSVPMAKIAVVMSGRDDLLLKASYGIPPEAAVSGVTIIPGGKGSALGYALLVGAPVLSNIDTETRFEPSEVVIKSGAKSSANVVIWAGDDPYGSLEADSREPNVFGEDVV